MIHSATLTSFAITILCILHRYEYYVYVLIISSLSLPYLLFKLSLHSKRPLLHVVGSLLIFFLIGTYVSHKISVLNQYYKDGFIYEDKTNLMIEGTISEFPSYRFANNQYILSERDSYMHVLLFTHVHQKYTYNQKISITGTLLDIRNQDAMWYLYYKKKNIHYVLFNPQIQYINFESQDSLFIQIKEKLFAFKNYLKLSSMKNLSSHASALLLGMLLGEKDELSKEEKEVFNKVGLSHILVVSGYNISLLISFVFILLKPFNKFVRIMVALSLIFLFVLLVGPDGSVVRAALMGSIIVFAKISRRHSGAVNVLFLVATIMLLYNPLSIFDAGFHLSFIATFSLLILPCYKKIPEFILTSIWVFLFVLFYIMYLSGYVSLGSVISNICVVFFLPIFMMFGFIHILLNSINLSIGVDIFILESLSRYIFLVSHVVQYIPRIQMHIAPSVLIVLYVILCNIVVFLKNRYTTKEFIEKHYQKFVPQKPN